MKTTTELQKSAVPILGYGTAQRRDEVICAQFVQSAFPGLLACNSFYDGDSFIFRDGVVTGSCCADDAVVAGEA